MKDFSRDVLFSKGLALIEEFCDVNNLLTPAVTCCDKRDAWPHRFCAYYRSTPAPRIVIHLPSTAAVGRGGAAWSWPGHTVDRTPYGVLAHELGHSLDYICNASRTMRAKTKEDALTGYAPNTREWFAELARLFITNPDLLKQLRPQAYAFLVEDLRLHPVVRSTWRKVLRFAPRRTVELNIKRVKEAAK